MIQNIMKKYSAFTTCLLTFLINLMLLFIYLFFYIKLGFKDGFVHFLILSILFFLLDVFVLKRFINSQTFDKKDLKLVIGFLTSLIAAISINFLVASLSNTDKITVKSNDLNKQVDVVKGDILKKRVENDNLDEVDGNPVYKEEKLLIVKDTKIDEPTLLVTESSAKTTTQTILTAFGLLLITPIRILLPILTDDE